MKINFLYSLKNLYGKIKKKLSLLHIKIVINSSKKKLNKIHNKYFNQRCFIIGNGPSLRVEDLEKLSNEFTFASHRIYKIFNKTTWRPTYYCAQDQALINDSFNEINNIDGCVKIIAFDKTPQNKINDCLFIKIHCDDFYPDLPKFSEDMLNGIYEGFTVTYMCIQLAIYMGFKEIILLGVDHSYSIEIGKDGQVIENKGIKDYFISDYGVSNDNLPQTYKSSLAYVAAKKYAADHDVKIYNATRGGKLEIFERINFDDIKF